MPHTFAPAKPRACSRCKNFAACPISDAKRIGSAKVCIAASQSTAGKLILILIQERTDAEL